MGKSIIGFFLILIHLSIAYPATGEEIDIGKKLDKFLIAYQKIDFKNKEDSIGRLIEIDSQLRNFLREIRKKQGHEKYWKSKYATLSLRIDHFTESFAYEGALLEKAHRINPKSKYRKYTLFSEINTDKYCWVEKPENLDAALQYVKEFPNGPFISEVYKALGGFNWSLYNYIRSQKVALKSKPHDELKHEETHTTLIKYIKENAKVPIELKENQAKEGAIKYFGSYLNLAKNPDPWVTKTLNEIQEGSKKLYGIYGCPD